MKSSKTAESREIQRLKEEIARLKKEAEDQKWGIAKTNEGIRMLYKELEKKNEELKKLDELKSEFVSTVSHEIRTPMTIIKESISQVLEGLFGDVKEEQRPILEMALKNMDRLKRIVDNLLDISKLEDGKFALNKEPFDLAEVVQDVCLSFEAALAKKGLTIDWVCSPEEILVNADRDKIIQVLTNLIGNGAKFTQQGGVTVAAHQNDKEVLCHVKDTGCGIAEKDLSKVFDKFRQFGRKSGAGEKGTGLGLAISKGIIELHGGSIDVKSRPGEGTTFTFTLPVNA